MIFKEIIMKNRITNFIFFFTFTISVLLLIYLCNIIYTSFLNKLSLENSFQQNNIFSINKIVFFSSAFGESTPNTNNTSTLKNIIQYTDIAIFIDNNSDTYSLENTLKSVTIENFKFIDLPKIGQPNLYYKNFYSIATPSFDENNLIKDSLNFDITSDDTADLSTPVLFNNCANPITISYKNSNLIDEHTIENSNSISYDGSLLKNCNIILNNLKCSFSFYIIIENNLGHKYRCPIYIDIPLSENNLSIYDGYFIYNYNPHYSFYLYT